MSDTDSQITFSQLLIVCCHNLFLIFLIISSLKGKDRSVYKKHGGFCLETQKFPNSVNQPNFPNSVVRPGDVYKHTVLYKLGKNWVYCSIFVLQIVWYGLEFEILFSINSVVKHFIVINKNIYCCISTSWRINMFYQRFCNFVS